jgi:HEAT repeat protein
MFRTPFQKKPGLDVLRAFRSQAESAILALLKALNGERRQISRNRTLATGLALFVVAVVMFMVLAAHPREPVYQGKSLSEWLALGRTGEHREVAQEAIRRMGTNTLPFLKAKLRAHDSRLKQKVMDFAAKQSLIKFSFTPAMLLNCEAALGCQALGPVAEPAIPDLIALLGSDWTGYAGWALAGVGPASVQPLAMALASTNQMIRTQAMQALTRIYPPLPAVTKVATQNLKHSDVQIRRQAADYLGQAKLESDIAVPVLIDALGDEDQDVRRAASWSLGRFGAQARAAIPSLIRMIREHNYEETLFATLVVAATDPENMLAELTPLIEDKDVAVRRRVLVALSWVTTKQRKGMQDLLDVLKGAEWKVEFSPGSVSVQITRTQIMTGYLHLPDRQDWNQSFVSDGGRVEPLLRALLNASRESDELVRSCAVRVLKAVHSGADARDETK